MADILTSNPNAKFQRAQVVAGDNSQVGEGDRHVINITLNSKDYQSFRSWELVEF
jgi:hypothetical protein